ncbi:conserved hypothetical protein [Theileria equi strain WA]|uniref:Uncharacterized protein n=1 Tax=Theileria equi strain WA TaxID=1537102 RepID=L1LC41_THEEQ|nr:conserved hypothetical protein [Theileria equi strain WA]EKX72733.1 conserved hypothetical protein [Theileria equi strain WA]|eukprot:XP_004832185.1 conserved hypothetical protein [Theileria equi strain WA]
MWVSSSRLRMAIAKSKKAKEKGKKSTDEDFRKGIHDTHKYVFMLIAYCMAPITGVSLLLESIFHCENIANKCYLSYIIAGSTSTMVSLICLQMSFSALVICFWMLMPGLIIFVPVIYFGNGQIAKMIFILLCGIVGILEAPILQASTFVISKLFLNSAASTLYSGYPFGLISMGLFQLVVEQIIGTGSIPQMRLCATLCYGVQAVVGFFTALWVTYLYIRYNGRVKEEEEKKKKQEQKQSQEESSSGGDTSASTNSSEPTKVQQLGKVIVVVPYYSPRLVIQTVGTVLRVFFHPCLIPFLIDLSNREKLVISLSFMFFDFIGVNYAGNFDETIDPSEKVPSQSHFVFLITRDLTLHLIWISTISLVSFIVWNIWTCEFEFTNSSFFLLILASANGFIGGIFTGRGLNGCFPILEYYNGQGVIGDDIIKLDNIINDIALSFDYIMCFLMSLFSNITERFILGHKNSREYILSNNKGDLSIETVNALLMQFRGVL